MQTVLCPNMLESGTTAVHAAATPARRTTLYNLIAALQEVVGADDTLVVATVVHLLRSGRLTWRGKPRVRPGLSQRVAMEAMPRVAPRTTAETSSSMGQREKRTP
jgi:hypothetical protein